LRIIAAALRSGARRAAKVCGLPAALSLTVSVPLRLPIAVGLKVTLAVQLVLLASVAGLMGQLLLCPKSPLSVPVIVMPLIVTAELPAFESVTV
jgi:hypothetical protein